MWYKLLQHLSFYYHCWRPTSFDLMFLHSQITQQPKHVRTIGSRKFAGLVAWHKSNAFYPINEVILRRTGLVLRWVTAYGQVNQLGM